MLIVFLVKQILKLDKYELPTYCARDLVPMVFREILFTLCLPSGNALQDGAVSCKTRRLGEAVTSDGCWGQCVDRQDGSLQPLTGGTPEEDPTFYRRASCLYSLIYPHHLLP